MGSVSNSLLSAINTLTGTPATQSNSGSSSGNTNTTGIFTGTSAYNQDFQNVINRAVAIASLPINLLTATQNDLNSQSTELTTLDTKFTALQTAIQAVGTAMGGASFESTSSAPAAVTATLSDGATQGIYNITVNNVGAAATSLSTASWSQTSTLASGQTATYDLLIGAQEYSVTTSDNSAQGVASAINAQYGDQVSAIAVNVSSTDTRISLQSATLGPVNLDVIQPPSGLQAQSATGYAVSQTTSTWDTSGGPYNLIVNGTNYSFTPATDSAQDVATAINATAAANGLNVNAQVIDLGGPDYRIQLEGTVAGAMTIDISNGSSPSMQTQQTAATSRTAATWDATADAPGTQSQYTLDVGASQFNFTVADNSAQTVAAAINTQFGAQVHATVVDVGPVGSPDYRIALQDLTGTNPSLNIQKTTNLQTQDATGYPVSQTTATWASAAGSYNLLINGTPYALSPTTDSAQDIATAINTAAEANALAVNATVTDLGTGGMHDYRIRLTGTTPGAVTLGIQNGAGPDLQTQQVPDTSLSGATWNAAADAAGTRTQYALVVGATTYNFVTADNSAQTVAAAINAQFGTQVSATVVNLGTMASPDYRIGLQDKTGTNPTLGIQESTATSFQTQQTIGALASYSLDGAPSTTSNSSSIDVANGVTLNLLGTNPDPVTGFSDPVSVTVTQSSGAISTALSAFADAYNACVTEIATQRGQAAGPLQGSSILSVLSQTLSNLSTYNSGSSSLNSLEDMGFTLDANGDGKLTFNALTFLSADFGNTSGVDAFLGSVPNADSTSGSSAGTGFLAAAANALTNLEDSTVGLLKTTESNLTTQMATVTSQIATKQTQVDQLQTTLTSQIAAADAAIAAMEQQYSYISSLLAAQQTANQQYTSNA